jgi:hypothetical protein
LLNPARMSRGPWAPPPALERLERALHAAFAAVARQDSDEPAELDRALQGLGAPAAAVAAAAGNVLDVLEGARGAALLDAAADAARTNSAQVAHVLVGMCGDPDAVQALAGLVLGHAALTK